MKIEFTGLRPGEKLFEELLMDDEMLTPTDNQQIFIGTQIHLDANMFIQDMAALKSCAEANDQAQVLQQLKKMVPTFHHQVDNEVEISASITA
jgi:FlaA1/EpsC-like NDP-sugar epimerase